MLMKAPSTRQRVNVISHATKDKGYRFIDKDPTLIELLILIEKSGKSWARISRETGVSYTTLRNWELGKTRRPQNVTMEFVARAVGYRRVWAVL